MIPALLGLSGKCKTLIDRLTATRAAAIDNLDAAVSTLAPAATALSNVTWTDSLASSLAGVGRLERAEVLSISGSTGAGTGSKTIDVTVSAVTTGKSFAFFAGGFLASTNPFEGSASFTTSTNLRIEYVDPIGATSYECAAVVVNFL